MTGAQHRDFANRFGQDPRASAEIMDAVMLWVLSRVDEALPPADRALADAGSAAHRHAGCERKPSRGASRGRISQLVD